MQNFSLKNPLFHHLTDRERAIIKANSSIINFKKEEILIRSSTRIFSIFYILKGVVKLKTISGKTFSLMGENDIAGIEHLYDNSPISYSIYGTEGAEIIQIEGNVIKNLMTDNSELISDTFNHANSNIKDTLSNLIHFREKKISGAIAYFLLFYNEKKCLKNLTQKDISEIIGYSRENICKSLKNFTEEGLINLQDNHEIKIIDFKGLEKIKRIG